MSERRKGKEMGELIDRQAAIKAVENLPDCPNGFSDTYDKACIIDVLEDLPSVQPKIIRCKDCKWKNHHNCTRAVEVWIDDDKFCAWAEMKGAEDV